MANFYLNTYTPLAATVSGRRAAQEYKLPPFIDGSIRREPDLQHAYPAISCLCRTDKFAPRLRVGDLVAYMTKKGRYGAKEPQRRLTAVLEVHCVFPNHQAAAQWYRDNGLPLPANCWIAGNHALPLSQSHRQFDASNCAGDRRTQRQWDAVYRLRAKQYPIFVVCRPLFRDLSWTAPTVEKSVLESAFGTMPGTQNPRKETLETFRRLMRSLKLPVSA